MAEAGLFELGIVALGGVIVVLLILVLLRAGRGGAANDATLREALSRADRAEMATTQREAEIARLAEEAAEQRHRLQEMDAQIRDQLATLSRQGERVDGLGRVLAERDDNIVLLTQELTAEREKVLAERRVQQDLLAQIATLETRIEAEAAAAGEKIALLSKVRDEMQERFRQLADEALRVQGEAFGKAQSERLEATLTPLKEHVGHFEKELREVHQETVKDRERLKTEILTLTRRSEQISQEAVALTRALKGDHQKQGAWGEMILENILERSGLRKGKEYMTQAHRTGDEGERLRPDVIVNIPGGKSLIIDSKCSLNDYAAAVNAETDFDMQAARKRHVAAMKAHITGLSGKGYQLAEGRSVDYVIMFVPIEGALSEALREDGTLTEFALDRHITIATPTTLMMALRTVANVWAVERRNQNAENIARRAGLLYDKVAGFVTSMEKVGKGMDSARGAYDAAMGQLARGRGNLLSQTEQLRALGAKASKTITLDFDGQAEPLLIPAEEEEPEEAVVE